MRPRQIEKEIELPNIKTSLVAYRDVSQKAKWYIRFNVPGPDGRYNPGIAVIPSYKVPKLISQLKMASEKMKLLEKQEYSGTFSEDFILRGEICDSLSVAISSQKCQFLFWSFNKIRIQFNVSSKTNTFSLSFDSFDLETIIRRLSGAESLAQTMMKQI